MELKLFFGVFFSYSVVGKGEEINMQWINMK